jgi:hypothetical protein
MSDTSPWFTAGAVAKLLRPARVRHSKATYGNRLPLITIAFDCN